MENSIVLVKTKSKIIELNCELARSSSDIANGLSNRHILYKDSGMVFMFSNPTNTRFWMLNTNIPLSIAFFDETGKILDIQDMEPNTLDPHSIDQVFSGALEMNQGWFEENDVHVGDTLTFPPTPSPLMLNEEVYYGNGYGQASHAGLHVTDEDSDIDDVVPWDNVHADMITLIHPRVISGKTSTTASKKFSAPRGNLSQQSFEAINAWREKYGKFAAPLEEKYQSTFGHSPEAAADNIRRLILDARESTLKDDTAFKRAGTFFTEDTESLLNEGAKLNYPRDLTSGVAARVSSLNSWWSNSQSFIHRGNQQDVLRILLHMNNLATTGVHVKEPIRAVIGSTKGKPQREIVIPAGHHDLSTLTDEQIAIMPQVKSRSGAMDQDRERAVRMVRRFLNKEPYDLKTQIETDNKAAYRARTQAPKIVTFDDIIKATPEERFSPSRVIQYAIDRHGYNAQANMAVPGSSIKEFLKAADDFSGKKKFPPGTHGAINSDPVGYELGEAVWEDGRRLLAGDGLKMHPDIYHSTGWISQILRSSESLLSQVKGDTKLAAQGFVRSPSGSGLFIPNRDKHVIDEDCEQLHDVFGI